MTIDLLMKKLKENNTPNEDAKHIVEDFFDFKEERYKQTDYKRREYTLKEEHKIRLSENYAFLKVSALYKL